MSTGDDFYFTGGTFSDWSGESAGHFSSSSTDHSSSSGSSSKGTNSSNNVTSNPEDWKYGCGCMTIIALTIIGGIAYFLLL